MNVNVKTNTWQEAEWRKGERKRYRDKYKIKTIFVQCVESKLIKVLLKTNDKNNQTSCCAALILRVAFALVSHLFLFIVFRINLVACLISLIMLLISMLFAMACIQSANQPASQSHAQWNETKWSGQTRKKEKHNRANLAHVPTMSTSMLFVICCWVHISWYIHFKCYSTQQVCVYARASKWAVARSCVFPKRWISASQLRLCVCASHFSRSLAQTTVVIPNHLKHSTRCVRVRVFSLKARLTFVQCL